MTVLPPWALVVVGCMPAEEEERDVDPFGTVRWWGGADRGALDVPSGTFVSRTKRGAP